MIKANEVVERQLHWKWYPYLPANSASFLFGPGKAGKSHITVDLAARFSTGDSMPGDESGKRTTPMRVLMLSAEDEYDTVLVPRLRRAGADLRMVAFPPDPFTLDDIGLKRLERYIKEWGPGVVTIDPIVHYMGGKVDMFRSNEVREVIGGLHQLALRTQTAILIVGHTRKGGEGDDWEHAMGSVDFINAVRSVLMTAKTNDGTRVLRHVNTNYAQPGLSIPYDFGDEGFMWGEPFPEGGEEVKSAPKDSKLGKERGKALSFLKSILANGPVPAKEVEALAKHEGLNPRTLSRAKIGLAESIAQRVDGKMVWIWKLIGDDDAEVHSVEGEGRAEAAVPARGGQGDGGVPAQPDTGAGRTVLQVANARCAQAPGPQVRSIVDEWNVFRKATGGEA